MRRWAGQSLCIATCSGLRTSATQTDNIRGFETKLSENEGPLKTAFAENQTTLFENLESSKSPQSSSICNHTLARGDLLDSRFSNNVVSFSSNVVLRGFLFSINVVSNPRMLSVLGVYVLGSLQL